MFSTLVETDDVNTQNEKVVLQHPEVCKYVQYLLSLIFSCGKNVFDE